MLFALLSDMVPVVSSLLIYCYCSAPATLVTKILSFFYPTYYLPYAVLYTVEFQKRGLPHAHIIFRVSTNTAQPTTEFIDSFITTEIPDPAIDPLGYALIAEHMVQRPCGSYNQISPCLKKGQCSKHYPKKIQNETVVDTNGFAVYKRSNNNRFVMKSNIKLDNRWIVPYNLTLLKKYQAHINVEWCNKSIFIKYLFKYVTKGPDRSKLYLQRVLDGQDTPIDEETNTRNEVKEYLDARFICPYDSCWRILGYEIHRHFPPVTRLPVHLPNENYITYHASANMSQILSQEFLRRTMLTEWFVANQLHESARSLTYPDFPSEWRWDEKKDHGN
jgi:hypothetical protein